MYKFHNLNDEPKHPTSRRGVFFLNKNEIRPTQVLQGLKLGLILFGFTNKDKNGPTNFIQINYSSYFTSLIPFIRIFGNPRRKRSRLDLLFWKNILGYCLRLSEKNRKANRVGIILHFLLTQNIWSGAHYHEGKKNGGVYL